MASRTLLLFLFLSVVHLCCGAPVLIGYSNVDIPPMPYYYVPAVISIAILFVVGLVFGCTCCPNKSIQAINQQYGLHAPRQPNDTSVLENVSEFAIFPPYAVVTDQSSLRSPDDKVTFDPLPDILPRKYTNKRSSITLRPTHLGELLDKRNFLQDWLDDSNKNFPREQLQYLKEVGCGWFGRVVEGEACNIVSGEEKSPVMVKILREEASPSEHLYFLHETCPYRDLLHPNIVHLLGRCLESNPFLLIMEHTKTNLKSYLIEHRNDSVLLQDGVLLRMACNVAAGLQYMHEHNFTQVDFAAHSCFVAEDLVVKIGDYGVSFETFKEDYYYFGDVALPVRWYSPEVLQCTETTIETKVITPEANVWAFGVVLWEIFQFGELPYEDLTNEEVLQKVIIEKRRVLDEPHFQFPQKERLYQIMRYCWRSVEERLKIQDVASLLNHLYNNRNNSCESPSFEERWNALKPAQGLCYISTHGNPVKFESDFVSNNHVLNKPSLFSSSDYDVSNVSEMSSFEYSGYNSHRASFDSYLSPSLQVLNGSIDGLSETNTTSNILGNESIISVPGSDYHPTLHLAKFQNCDAESELSIDHLRHSGDCSISLGQYAEITADGNNSSLFSHHDFKQSTVGETMYENDSLPASSEKLDHSGRNPCRSVVKDVVSCKGDGKCNTEVHSLNHTGISFKTTSEICSGCTREIYGEITNKETMSGLSGACTLEPSVLSICDCSSNLGDDYYLRENEALKIIGSTQRLEGDMVSSISHAAKISNVNNLAASENRESPFTVCISHNSSNRDNIVPDIVISKSSFDERSHILDNKSVSQSTNESPKYSVLPKRNFNFVLNESSHFDDADESSKDIESSVSCSDLFESVEEGDIPFTSTPAKVKDHAPSSENSIKDANSSFMNCTSVLYETANDRGGENADVRSSILKTGDECVGNFEKCETELTNKVCEEIQNENGKNDLNVDFLPSRVTDHSQFQCINSHTEVSGSTLDFNKISDLFPYADSVSQDSPGIFNSVYTLPADKEQNLNIQELDTQITSETDHKHDQQLHSNNTVFDAASPPSPVDNCSDRNTSKQISDKNMPHFSTGNKMNCVSIQPDVFNVELVKDLEFSVDVQTLPKHNPPVVPDINLHNAFSEFKNNRNKIQDKVFNESGPVSFLNRKFDVENCHASPDIYHSKVRKNYENISSNNLSNELSFTPCNGIVPFEDKAQSRYDIIDRKNDVHPLSKNKDVSYYNEKHENIYQSDLEMDNKNSLNYDGHKSSSEISCKFLEDRSKKFCEKDVCDTITIEDLETGEQQLVPQTVICNFDDDDDDDDDDVLKIDTETNEAIIVDSSESLIGFVPSRSIEQLQECSTILAEESISPNQSACRSVQEENNSCTNSPTAPSAVFSGNKDAFVTDDELSERTADILDDIVENGSVHNDENVSGIVNDIYHSKTNDLPDLCKHLPKVSDGETSYNILDDRNFCGASYRDSVLDSITLESEEILAGDPSKLRSSKCWREGANSSPSVEFSLNPLDIVVSPTCSAASTPCREVYTPDFESDSDESSSGTSCTSTSGSFECIHNKFKHVIDVSVCDDNSEGNLTNESSLESSPVKVFSKCWDSTATPTRGLLKTPENKVQMKKSVSFHEEGPHEIFQYPPPSDSSEDDFVDDDDFSWHVDYTSYADWDLQADDEDDIPEEIIEIEELSCDKGLTPSYNRGISLRPIPGPMLYTLTGFTEDDLELPEMMGSSQFHTLSAETEGDVSISESKWAQDTISGEKDSTITKSESTGKPFDSLELIIEEVQSDVETASNSDKESTFSLPSNGFADFSSDLSLKRDFSSDDNSSIKERCEGHYAKYSYSTVSPDGFDIEIISPDEEDNSFVGHEFSYVVVKDLVSDFSESKLPAVVPASSMNSAAFEEADDGILSDCGKLVSPAELVGSDDGLCDNSAFRSKEDVLPCTNANIQESISEDNFESNNKTGSTVDFLSNKNVVEEVQDVITVPDMTDVPVVPGESVLGLCTDTPHGQKTVSESCKESSNSECAWAMCNESSDKSLGSNEKEQCNISDELSHNSASESGCDFVSCTALNDRDSSLRSSEASDMELPSDSSAEKNNLMSSASQSLVSCHDSFPICDIVEEKIGNTTSALKEVLESDVHSLSEVDDSLLSEEKCHMDFTVDSPAVVSCHDYPATSEPNKNGSSSDSFDAENTVTASGTGILLSGVDSHIPPDGNVCAEGCEAISEDTLASVDPSETIGSEEGKDQKIDAVGAKISPRDGLLKSSCGEDILDKDLPYKIVNKKNSLCDGGFHSDEDIATFHNSVDSAQSSEKHDFVENITTNQAASFSEASTCQRDYGNKMESAEVSNEYDTLNDYEDFPLESVPVSCYQKKLEHCAEDSSLSSCDGDVSVGSFFEADGKLNSTESFISSKSKSGEPKIHKVDELVPEERKDVKFVIPSIIITDADDLSFDDETESFIKHFGIFSAARQIADDDSQFAIMSEFSNEPFEDNFAYMCGAKIEEKDRIF